MNLTLGELPNAREARAETEPDATKKGRNDEPRLGLSLAAAAANDQGVVVAEVDPSGPAADSAEGRRRDPRGRGQAPWQRRMSCARR